ncbi:MAG: acyl-CoA dehydrogenase family protein, partial [bacterium]|nr:acyl-CoA dehydrogenase family protein [bacterium]
MRRRTAGVTPHWRRLTTHEPGARPVTLPDFNALSDEAFRNEARAFFVKHYPQHLRYILRRARWSEVREWYLTLSRHGWIAPNWPREHGGMGLDAGKLMILFEEQERYGVARTPDHGIVQVGPILMKYGSKPQQQYYLPKILSGEH